MFTVWNWQFIEERFVPRIKTYDTQAEAWAYVRERIAEGKDIGDFRVLPTGEAMS